VRIDIPRLLLRLRAEVVEGTPAGTAGHHGPVVRRPIERLAFRAFAWSASSRARYEWTARLGRIAQRVLVRNGRIGTLGRALGALLPPLGAWTAARDLRPLAPRSFREMWEGEPQGLKARGHTGPGPLDLTASAAVRPAASDMRPAAVDTRPAARDLRPATLTERFRTAVGAVAGRCTVVADLRGAADVVQSILASHRCRRVALSDSPLVRRALDEVAFEGELVRAGDTDTFFSCDIGITAAQWGIADTGTLVLDGDAERHRLASLVPPVHVALLPASRLRATLGTVLAELAACDRDAMSRVVTFITGPSRTSDIELTLAIGVHGPGELHVIVVGDTDA
jgi:L-lactate utilization protein LutC